MSTTEWKLVPDFATTDMMDAGVAAARREKPDIEGQVGFVQVRAIFDAMLAASPSPASPADDVAGLIDRAEQLAASLNRGSADIVLELAAALSRLQASLAEVTAELTTTEQLRHEENRRACSETEKRWASEASAATMREALTKIAAPYDGEGDTLLVPLQKIGTELRKRQQIARAALGGQHG